MAARDQEEWVNIFLPIALRHLKKTRYPGEKCQGNLAGARLHSTRHICKIGISEAVGDGLRCFPSRRKRSPRRVGTGDSGHRACGQRAVPPESNAVPIRKPAASAALSGPSGPVLHMFTRLFFCLISWRWIPSPTRPGGCSSRNGKRGKVSCGCCGVLRVGRWFGGRALPQTRRIATAAMAAITSNSVRAGRFIGSDS
jgi:hypothetical protein